MVHYTCASPQPYVFGSEFALLTETISQLGFDGVLYSFYPKPMYLNSKIQPVLHYSNVLAPFVAHYIKNNYGNHDFVLRLILQNRKKKPIDWWEEINADHVTSEERVVTEDARQNFGIYYGLSIPALHGTYAVAGISVISQNPCATHFQQLKSLHMDKLFELSSQYHAKIINSREELRFFLLPLLQGLNETQKKVVKHTLEGLPMKAIPTTYGITPKYAEKVWSNIRKEFGDITTNELIYIMGMVDLYEYL
ncbi:helix-turn-helix transcriptional regulator [Thiofilum flexile]|uniref:helix-turn-helix transcriptional regulator n=1 Tax=Thiofilum flexile TaxID=125627 RepID=UPI000378BF45|nr:autoinducer binding domain-containing protein [Thiofilum flexile]